MAQYLKKYGNDARNQIFVRMDTDKLEEIEKKLKLNYAAQIGILGSGAAGRLELKTERVGGKSGNRKVPVVQGASPLSNADIGLIHEKGSPLHNIPRRSFLEVPLTTKLPGMIGRVKPILEKLGIEEAYKKLAAICESIVLQAFPTSGYGTWPALGHGALNKEGRHEDIETGPSHLIKTGQLHQSIASRVVQL